MNPRTHIYFASDFHFGIPGREQSLVREKLLIRWLDSIAGNAREIYLMGDVFDFWFEYRTVVPKGFVRLLGKLAELTDAGIPVHLFRGNHDVWAFDYLRQETGLVLHRHPEICRLGEKTFYLNHGDGYGPGDYGYKFLKAVFANPVNQWLFRWLHPDLGTRMGLFFSRKSRLANMAREGRMDAVNRAGDERLVIFCREHIKKHPGIDFYILGHRHQPMDYALDEHSRCIILGDWITHFSYAVFDGNDVSLQYFR